MTISAKTRKMLWARAGNQCALCRLPLVIASPDGDGHSIVGDECHIVARADGGPRSDPKMPVEQRDGYQNLILLCKVHHKLIDDEPETYPVEQLLQIKGDHEERVARILRQAVPAGDEQEKIRQLALRKRLRSELISHNDEVHEIGYSPHRKYDFISVVVHSIEDMSYGDAEDRPPNAFGYSGWFKVEMWDLYHDGIELITGIEYGGIDADGRWTVLEPGQELDDDAACRIKMYRVGRIPLRNIVDFDASGDEYYPVPHLYCRFADAGGPFSEYIWIVFESECELGVPLPWQLNPQKKQA